MLNSRLSPRLPSRYRPVLTRPGMPLLLVVGYVARLPMFAVSLVTTLHVVRSLGRSYTEAGIAGGVLVVAIGISGPWRGRLLDRFGLRRVLAPSLVVLSGYAVVAPQLGYTPLLVAQALAGLFFVPVMPIMRQAVMASAGPDHRRTALALDGMGVELAAATGPLVAVWAATSLPTALVLRGVSVGLVLIALLLMAIDPPLRAGGEGEVGGPRPSTRSWLSAAFVAIIAAATASTVILTGTDLASVAFLNDSGRAAAIGWVLALWALASLVGGLVYGALPRSIDPFWLLLALGVTTLVPILASGPVTLALLLLVPGLLCQPAITAALERLTDVVPETARGEAMGWHSTAMTSGTALGAPVAGAAIDAGGAPAGFVVCAAVGIVVALVGLLGRRRRVTARAAG